MRRRRESVLGHQRRQECGPKEEPSAGKGQVHETQKCIRELKKGVKDNKATMGGKTLPRGSLKGVRVRVR